MARITEETLRQAIEQNEWRFAKTMPRNPHWYALRENWVGELDFNIFIIYIRQFGYNTKYRGWNYVLLDIDGYSYWTMGAPIPLTILINRKEIV